MKLGGFVLFALATFATGQNARNSREFLQGNLPFLGSYWESYLRYQTRPEECLDLTAYNPPEHADDFGYSIANTPREVSVIYIAFGHTTARACERSTCEPYICGLHLYGIAGIEEDKFEELKEDIASLQSAGHSVLLAYGGEEYGNIDGFYNTYDLSALAGSMVDAVNSLGLDGVEIVNEIGCGSWFATCGSQTSAQLQIISL